MDASRVFAPDQLWMPAFVADPYPTFRNLRDQGAEEPNRRGASREKAIER